jgi:hypothetical protein
MKNLVLFPIGGLGNLILQFACAFSISKKYNAKLYINYDYVYDGGRYTIKKYENFFNDVSTFVNNSEVREIITSFYEYTEPRFKFTEIHDFSSIDTVILRGYFQSWKYFYENIKELRSIFQSKNTMKEVHKEISIGKKTVCVHVRRCDYLQFQDIHPVMTEEYYENAMMKHADDKDTLFLIFAEDYNDDVFMNWKLWSKFGERIIFLKDVKDALDTFFLMSLCDHFIIANSSLSLCAYYFRTNLQASITYPENWFGSNGYEFDIHDLIF